MIITLTQHVSVRKRPSSGVNYSSYVQYYYGHEYDLFGHFSVFCEVFFKINCVRVGFFKNERQILLKSSHLCLVIHIMFHCGGLTCKLFLSSIKHLLSAACTNGQLLVRSDKNI